MTELFNNVAVSLICRAARVPLIFSMHTDLAKLGGGPKWISDWSLRTTASNSAITVTTSPSFRTLMQNIGVRECTEYYRPVPCDGIVQQYEKLSDADVRDTRARLSNGFIDRKLLVYVGRWSHEKRMHLLVRCLPENTMLSFVGDGKIHSEVQAWADADPRIVCCRGMVPRDKLAVIYAAADWVVSASDFETFGNVPFEAAHCGTPALLQRAQGFVDQIDEQEHRGALLEFDSENGLNQLESAMSRTEWLLSRPDIVKAAAKRSAETGATIGQLVSRLPTKVVEQASYEHTCVYFLLAICVSALCSVFVTICKPIFRLMRDVRRDRKSVV